MKFPYYRGIDKPNTMEYMKKHSPTSVITSHVVSRTREVQLLGMEMYEYP